MTMRVLAAAATVLLAATAFADQPSFRFDNGLWFNGERFVVGDGFRRVRPAAFRKKQEGCARSGRTGR